MKKENNCLTKCSIMYTADEILDKVNEYIGNLSYGRRPQSLYEPIRYVLSLGGKRIRPTLMLLSYNLFRDDPETILSPACALETYHNYTLLHDDLMDDAPLRRGQQTVHVRWDANTAILSGDSMLVLAFERMQQCDDRHLRDVLRLFTVTALEIGEGQQYDMEFENRNDVTEAELQPLLRPLHGDWCVFCLLIHCIIGSYFVYLSIKNSIIFLPWHTNPRIPMSM